MSLLLFSLSRVSSRVACCFLHAHWYSAPVFVSCELTVGRSASYLKVYSTFSIHTPPHSCAGHCCNQCLTNVTLCLVLVFGVYLYTSTSVLGEVHKGWVLGARLPRWLIVFPHGSCELTFRWMFGIMSAEETYCQQCTIKSFTGDPSKPKA